MGLREEYSLAESLVLFVCIDIICTCVMLQIPNIAPQKNPPQIYVPVNKSKLLPNINPPNISPGLKMWDYMCIVSIVNEHEQSIYRASVFTSVLCEVLHTKCCYWSL